MEFLMLLVLIALAYLVWRIVDQLPDIVFRLGEIQRDIAEIRRHVDRPATPPAVAADADATVPPGPG
jgi:hypothetical protein